MSKDADFTHFCDLAARGIHPGASGGEKAAAALARAAYDHFVLLDFSAQRGFGQWLAFVEQSPSNFRDLMEGWGYDFD